MAHKQGSLSRADLLMALMEQDAASQQVLLAALGLDYSLAAKQNKGWVVEQPAETVLSNVPKIQMPENMAEDFQCSPTAELSATYWQLLKQEQREAPDDEDQLKKKPTVRPVWEPRPAPPAFPALMPEAEIRQRLLPILRQNVTGRAVDYPRLLEQWARAEFIIELPRQRQRKDSPHWHLMDDRQSHLMPYWLDHTWLTVHLRSYLPEYRWSQSVIEAGELPTTYAVPSEGSTIILLSDLGRLGAGVKAYLPLLQHLNASAQRVVVITPCQLADYPALLHQLASIVPWQMANQPTRPFPTMKQAEQLLMLASVVVRLEPELLRVLRYALNEQRQREGQPPFCAALESLVWQHRAVQPHIEGATLQLKAEQQQAWAEQWQAQAPALQSKVLESIRQWRARLPQEIWFEELAHGLALLNAETQADLPWLEQDRAQAAAFLNTLPAQAGQFAESTEGHNPYKDWLKRLDRRLNQQVIQQDSVLNTPLQQCLQLVSTDGKTPAGHVLDPQLDRNTTKLPTKSAWLCQRVNQWVINQHNPFQVPQQRSRMIARLDYRALQLKVIQADKSFAFDLPAQLDEGFTPLLGTEDLAPEALRIQTDLTELQLVGVQRPQWAKRVGRDAYGLFAELAIPNDQGRKLVQCFRWIPAGTFMMGSPESEAERNSNEDYHQVTLTLGYWLADTAVTQGVWKAVMGENPARFKKSAEHPVEQVSWDDCQTFIERLNQALAGLLDGLVVRLPTEAEWEHACRAGTKTPFSFGEHVTSKQVNFDGSRPYNQGEKSYKRGKTVAVKSLPANPWGLYEMHGNVWEWCADAWLEHSGTQAMIDPYHSADSAADSALRVFRGGSWNFNGGRVRSACRGHYSPENRYKVFLGCRFALGHELRARSVE